MANVGLFVIWRCFVKICHVVNEVTRSKCSRTMFPCIAVALLTKPNHMPDRCWLLAHTHSWKERDSRADISDHRSLFIYFLFFYAFLNFSRCAPSSPNRPLVEPKMKRRRGRKRRDGTRAFEDRIAWVSVERPGKGRSREHQWGAGDNYLRKHNGDRS